MSCSQSSYVPKQESTIHNEQKNKSIETDPEMIELVVKDINEVIITIPMFKKKRGKTDHSKQGMENMAKIQIELLLLKDKISEMKNTLNSISRLDTTEDL